MYSHTCGIDMDSKTAKTLFHTGATLIVLNMPEGAEFGIDYNSWNIGPKFKGLKMIPPGIHFIYYSSCNKMGDGSPRTGFFHNFGQKEIVIKTWDKQTEEMKNTVKSEDEINRWRENIQDVDQFLGPYPYEHYKKWISLSNHITQELLEVLLPESGIIASVTECSLGASNSQSRKLEKLAEMEVPISLREAESRLTNMCFNSQSSIHFSEIPKQKFPPNSSPRQMSKYNIDSSYVLQQLISKHYNNNEQGILGEIQFSFICFHIGQVYDGFEQWKRLVDILCTCEEVLSQYTQLFLDLILLLHFQVHEIPEDFFVDIVSSNNFLTTTLHIFFSNLDNIDVDQKLRKRGLRFKDHLTEKFKWDFSEEPEEFAPIIVECDTDSDNTPII